MIIIESNEKSIKFTYSETEYKYAKNDIKYLVNSDNIITFISSNKKHYGLFDNIKLNDVIITKENYSELLEDLFK